MKIYAFGKTQELLPGYMVWREGWKCYLEVVARKLKVGDADKCGHWKSSSMSP